MKVFHQAGNNEKGVRGRRGWTEIPQSSFFDNVQDDESQDVSTNNG